MGTNPVHQYVDNAIGRLEALGVNASPDPNMPVEMYADGETGQQEWKHWQGIDSIVTDEDLNQLEQQIGYKLPLPYRQLLQYRHFYKLDNVGEINLLSHVYGRWKDILLDQYYNYNEPDEIIHKGYVPFAYYSDWGIVCFDTNRMTDGDCPVVMLDHECLWDDPVPVEELYPSVQVMFSELVKEQQARMEQKKDDKT